MTGTRTTQEQYDQIKLLLDKGVETKDIVEICHTSSKTVRRIREGIHYLSPDYQNKKHEVDLAKVQKSIDEWTSAMRENIDRMNQLIQLIQLINKKTDAKAQQRLTIR